MRSMVLWGHTEEGCILPECSHAEWARIVAFSCGFRCFYCAENLTEENPTKNHKNFTVETATKDHLWPISRGGCRCCGNLVASCRRCNCMKKQKTVYEFLKMKPALVETTGRFYTRIICLKAICDPSNDPLLKEVRRLAEKKAFPRIPSYRMPSASIHWRTR